MQERVEQLRENIWWWLLGSFVALLISGGLWFQLVYKDPQHVFESMLRGTMSVTGYTKETITEQGETKNVEVRRLQFGAEPISETTVTQQTANTTVRTETISTLDQQYVKFADIQTEQKTSDGKAIDFSSVVGVWGKGQQAERSANGPFVGDAISGSDQYTLVVPMGNLSAQDRPALLRYLIDNHVFVPSYQEMRRETLNGRQVYVYPVQLQMQTYVEYLKRFGQAMGAAEYVSGLDPSQYAGIAPQNVTMYVDPLSRQLVRFDYNAGIARQDVFSSYGLLRSVDLPRETIEASELQQRINQVVSGE